MSRSIVSDVDWFGSIVNGKDWEILKGVKLSLTELIIKSVVPLFVIDRDLDWLDFISTRPKSTKSELNEIIDPRTFIFFVAPVNETSFLSLSLATIEVIWKSWLPGKYLDLNFNLTNSPSPDEISLLLPE